MRQESDERPRRGRPPVSAQGRHEQRLEISRHAVRLFREHGVAATSGDQIARAAGVSGRTFWRLFGSKEACVEPLLTEMINGISEVLRSWPPDVELAEHLDASYTFVPEAASRDTDAVLAVVRLSRGEPGLRATWLVLQERAEPAFAAALGPRMGLPVDAPEVRVHAAAMNAALRVATDDFAWTVDEDVTSAAVREHREHLVAGLRAVTRVPQRPRGSRTSAR